MRGHEPLIKQLIIVFRRVVRRRVPRAVRSGRQASWMRKHSGPFCVAKTKRHPLGCLFVLHIFVCNILNTNIYPCILSRYMIYYFCDIKFNILSITQVCIFYPLVKMHALFSHTCVMRKLCVATIGAMHFSCVASAAHFLL